ncbi:MFS transporter [Lentzea sp. NPDC051838]|uniref:MFS transporter n=1 Tax=Lentzea sp. NPDC051838 TaxID=3154849 RepID=UPI003437F3FB
MSNANHGRTGLVLLACCVGQLLVVLDGTIMNVALPSIESALKFDANSLQWVINAYLIPTAGLLLLAGRMADLFSRRGFFLAGIALFTVASLAGGFAQDATQLIIARAFQGVGVALMSPATLTVLGTTFTEPAQRAKAFGLWGAAGGSGGAIGVLAGGVVTDWLSWRWVLLINVPVGIALFIVAAISITPTAKHVGPRKLDILGAVSVTIGIAALVFAIAQGEREGWGSPVSLISFAVAVVGIGVFLFDQAKLASEPLVPLSVFRNRAIVASNVAMFCVGAAMASTFYFLTLLMQFVLGYSPLTTGLSYLPLSVAIFLGAGMVAPQTSKLGGRFTLISGLVVGVIGLGWLALATDNKATFVADLLGPSLLFGVGVGMVLGTVANLATAALPSSQQGLASGLLTTGQALGGAAGLAVLVAVANATGGETRVPEEMASGYANAFIGTAILLVIAALAAVAMPKVAKSESDDSDESAPKPVAVHI